MKEFVNGFESWQETHFEIASAIFEKSFDLTPQGIVHETEEDEGRMGLYRLAKRLTDKFENLHKGRLWEGDYFEAIDEFIKQEL